MLVAFVAALSLPFAFGATSAFGSSAFASARMLRAPSVSTRSGYVTLPVRLASGFTPTRASRSLRLAITQAGCGPRYSHAQLRWSPHRLTVTLLARPYEVTADVACPAYIALLTITVQLHRSLGDRAIYDGRTNPPRLVTAAPSA